MKKIFKVIFCSLLSFLLVLGGNSVIFGTNKMNFGCGTAKLMCCCQESFDLVPQKLDNNLFLAGKIDYTPGFDKDGNKLFCSINNVDFWLVGDNRYKYYFAYGYDSYYSYISDNGKHVCITVYGTLYEDFCGKTFETPVYQSFICNIDSLTK